MTNVKTAMEYAAKIDREARDDRLNIDCKTLEGRLKIPMNKNEEKAYEDAFVAGMQHEAKSRVSKFMEAAMRKWISLTDEEINSIDFPESGTATMRDFVRIIEAKLKDKNNG